ncbi:hypothetical protein DOTSEDRAFT_53931 [Dothistroma septosporum NZE10]|uniref:Alpha/beta hydrolase fold-3 domain-containing protein n=1 Tax=Dothistroma septosporum (strain NZE10 / CBS 128990) TaxID=675120 RepID=M2Y3W8_DOTSN|nr:hypothetical protein DOTSEDRAFT_53931 [Dothistroma septosporum NZE10]
MADDSTNNAARRPSTIKVTQRHDRSFMMLLLQTFLRPFNQRLVSSSKEYPAGSPQTPPPRKAAKKLNITEREVDNIYLYDLSPKHPAHHDKTTTKRRLYYFAGGGWSMPASSEHWSLLTELCLKLPDTAISLDVILAGDSAGGNIVLSLVVNAVVEDASSATCPPCPSAVLAISPSTDLRRCNPEMKEIEKKDPLLRLAFANGTAAAWCGETSKEHQAWDRSDPRVSPLLADLGPLAKRGVKIHGVTGGYDILCPDAILFRKKCDEAGVDGEWLHWDKQMHVFPLVFSFRFREGVEAKDWILDVLRRT